MTMSSGDIEPRNMLILQDKNNLKPQEIWLCKAYTNIVSKIVKIAKEVNSTIDPFASEFIGKNSISANKTHYHSLLEITTYFWASKGGRGKVLQKALGALAGDTASEDVYLSNYLSELIENKGDLKGEISDVLKIKIDLVNIIGDKLVILEIKNRIDSGGTSARVEMIEKFFGICDTVEHGTTIFTDINSGKGYTLAELLANLEIKELQMLSGVFYNTTGKEATLDDDRHGGFYSKSKLLFEQYGRSHFVKTCKPDQLLIKLYKDEINFQVQAVYGDNVAKSFVGNKATVNQLITSVFKQRWDDMWLSLNTGIEQRRILLECNNNHFLEIARIYKENKNIRALINKFKSSPTDVKSVKELVERIQTSMDPGIEKITSGQLADCLYVCSRFIK